MTDIGIVSPNMLKLFFDCPMKYYWRYQKQVSPPVLDKNFDVGKNIHAIASYYLKGENVAKFEHALNETEKKYWNYLKSVDYFRYDTVGIEKSISCKINDYWIGGRIDAIAQKDNNLYILDYKTGGIKEDMTYDYQTMIYMLCCDSLYENFNSLKFIYIDLKNQKNIEINYTNDLKIEYKNRLVSDCNKINSFKKNKFIYPKNCKCEYSKICKTNIT